MASANHIDVLISMLQAAKYEQDAKKAAKATSQIGTAAEQTGKQAGVSFRSLMKWAGTTTVFATAAHYLHGAVEETMSLAKASLQLQRLTGLDVKTSSEWVIIAQQRGIEAQRLGQMFTQLGRVQQRAIAGSKQQALAFQQVGLSVHDLKTLDTTGIVTRIADAFQAMPNGLQKAALAQQFFGRTGRQLLPLLNAGGASLQEQLDLVEKYGAALEGKTAKDVQKMIVRQREMQIASMGVKEQLSDALIPTLTALSQNLRVVLVALSPLLHNQLALRAVLILLAAGWVIYTVAVIGAAVANATWLLTAAPFILIAAAIGAAIYLLITHWGDLTSAMETAWRWVKTHWEPLALALGGPFTVMAIVIAKAVRFILDHIHQLVRPVSWLIGKAESIAGFAGGLVGVSDGGSGAPNVPRGPQPVALAAAGAGGSGGGPRVVAMQGDVHMDGQKGGKVIWKNADDRGARR